MTSRLLGILVQSALSDYLTFFKNNSVVYSITVFQWIFFPTLQPVQYFRDTECISIKKLYLKFGVHLSCGNLPEQPGYRKMKKKKPIITNHSCNGMILYTPPTQ